MNRWHGGVVERRQSNRPWFASCVCVSAPNTPAFRSVQNFKKYSHKAVLDAGCRPTPISVDVVATERHERAVEDGGQPTGFIWAHRQIPIAIPAPSVQTLSRVPSLEASVRRPVRVDASATGRHPEPFTTNPSH